MRCRCIEISQCEQPGEQIGPGEEDHSHGLIAFGQPVQTFEDQVFPWRGKRLLGLKVLAHESGRFFIALAFEFAGDAAGEKVLEFISQVGAES